MLASCSHFFFVQTFVVFYDFEIAISFVIRIINETKIQKWHITMYWPDWTEFVVLWSMFDDAIDSDTVDEDDVPVGDLISLLTTVRSAAFFLLECPLCNALGDWIWVWTCSWVEADDGKLFDVVTSDTWHGSRFIYDDKKKTNEKTHFSMSWKKTHLKHARKPINQ